MSIDKKLNTEKITPELINYIAVDLLVRKPKEVEWNFRAQNPFYLYHIFRDGKVLYEKS